MADSKHTLTIVTEDKGNEGGKGSKPFLMPDGRIPGSESHRLSSGRENPVGTGTLTSPDIKEFATGLAASGAGPGAMPLNDPDIQAFDEDLKAAGVARGSIKLTDEDLLPEPEEMAPEESVTKKWWEKVLGQAGETIGGSLGGALGLLTKGLGAVGDLPGPVGPSTMGGDPGEYFRGTGQIVGGGIKRAAGAAESIVGGVSKLAKGAGAAGGGAGAGGAAAAATAAGAAGGAGGAAGAAAGGGMAGAAAAGPVGVAVVAVKAFSDALVAAVETVAKWISWMDKASEEVQAFSPNIIAERVETTLALLNKRIERAAELGEMFGNFEAAKRDMMLAWEDAKTELMKVVGPVLIGLMKVATMILKALLKLIKHTLRQIAMIILGIVRVNRSIAKLSVVLNADTPAMLAMEKWAKEILGILKKDKVEDLWHMFDRWMGDPKMGVAGGFGGDMVNVLAD